MRILFAGGGTGGHLYPGIAVADELRRRDPATLVSFVGTARGLESRVVPALGLPLDLIRSAGLKGKSLMGLLRGLALLPLSALDAWRVLSARRPDVVATPALGPDDRLVDIVLDRLRSSGATAGMPVVLVPAGSSDARAQADSAAVAEALARRWGGPVTLGFAAGPQPSAADAVVLARESSGGRVALASYLLAPGFFQRRLEDAGAAVVTGPLAPDERIVDIVVDRYRVATS